MSQEIFKECGGLNLDINCVQKRNMDQRCPYFNELCESAELDSKVTFKLSVLPP